MLLLSRKAGQSITLDLDESVDGETSLRDLLTAGCVEVHIVQVDGSRVELGIEAQRRPTRHHN